MKKAIAALLLGLLATVAVAQDTITDEESQLYGPPPTLEDLRPYGVEVKRPVFCVPRVALEEILELSYGERPFLQWVDTNQNTLITVTANFKKQTYTMYEVNPSIPDNACIVTIGVNGIITKEQLDKLLGESI